MNNDERTKVINDTVDRAVEAVKEEDIKYATLRVIDAWCNPGPSPLFHNRVKERLQTMWPSLYHALLDLERRQQTALRTKHTIPQPKFAHLGPPVDENADEEAAHQVRVAKKYLPDMKSVPTIEDHRYAALVDSIAGLLVNQCSLFSNRVPSHACENAMTATQAERERVLVQAVLYKLANKYL